MNGETVENWARDCFAAAFPPQPTQTHPFHNHPWASPSWITQALGDVELKAWVLCVVLIETYPGGLSKGKWDLPLVWSGNLSEGERQTSGRAASLETALLLTMFHFPSIQVILLIREVWDSLPRREVTLSSEGEADIWVTHYRPCFREDLKKKSDGKASLREAENNKTTRLSTDSTSLLINQSSNLSELLKQHKFISSCTICYPGKFLMTSPILHLWLLLLILLLNLES